MVENYPQLQQADVMAALAFASDMLREERYVAIHQAADQYA